MNPEKKILCILDSSFVLPSFSHKRSLFSQFLEKNRGDIAQCYETLPSPESLNNKEFRRMSRLTRLAVTAADKIPLSTTADTMNCGLSIGITHGSTSLLTKFLDYLFDYGPEMASPNAFSNGVTNATLGAVSRHLGIDKEGITIMGEENCGILALEHAWEEIRSGMYEVCLTGCSEEYSDKVDRVYQKLGWFGGKNIPEALPFLPENQNETPVSLCLSEGSAFFLVTTPENASSTTPETGFTVEFIDDSDSVDPENQIDLIISGASGGPQDRYEFKEIKKVAESLKTAPGLLFYKVYTGENFAVSSMIGILTAMDIISHKEPVPVSSCIHPKLKNDIDTEKRADQIHSVLLTSCTRHGESSLVIIKKR